jgi:serine/threonine protein kinase/tetratricopeptide (TPR) repeat protein
MSVLADARHDQHIHGVDATELHTSLQRGLGSSYTLERELGGGGMSRVFLAEETALGRRVVVKVLAPELTEGLSAERFAREVRLAARLQHPNIVPVLAAGDSSGVPYYTMPYVDGESLRARLDRGGLSVAEAVGILRDLARALAYAHEHGVVHRDVKPENVLLSGDTAVVADFGIAKAVDAARAGQSNTAALTQFGLAIGTPAYMAPEQAAGESTIDHRADLYAWGIVAYELFAGQHPFAGKKSAQALLAAHIVESPAPLGAVRAGVPAGLTSLVMGCLAKDPQHRPRSAREIVEALMDSSSIGAFATNVGPTLPSIAVLPFVNLSADPENEYFSDGISEEVLSVLAQDRGLRVAARSSSFAFKGRQSDLRAIAAQLHVTMLLEGSVRRAGNRVRISAQLVNAADGYQLWSDRYDRELTDILAVQDEIATAIGATLSQRFRETTGDSSAVASTAHAPRARARVSVEAYDAYLKGRYANRNLRGTGHEPGPAHFRRALELEPTFVAAHTGLAESLLWLAVFGTMPPGEAFPAIRRHARRALSLDPDSADAHWLLGEIALWYDWDVEAAEEHATSALALEEHHAEATMTMAACHMTRRRAREALAAAGAALQIDPVGVGTRLWFSAINFNVGAFETARAEASRLVDAHPEFSEALRWRAMAHLLLGDLDAARADVAAARSMPTSNISVERCYAVVAGQSGDVEMVRSILDSFLERSEREWISPLMIAQAYQALGDNDTAFHWYERAYQVRDNLLTVLHTDRSWQLSPPGMSTITNDPRWDSLIRRIGVAP